MRSGLPLLMVAAMIVAGCQSVSYQTADSAKVEPVVFSSRETDVSRALAAFLYGRVIEGENKLDPHIALPYYHVASQLAPGSHTIQGRIALAALLRADIDAAIEAMDSSYEAKPGDPLRQLDLAALYRLAGRNSDAARLFEQSIEAAPTNTAVYIALGDIYLDQDKHEDAINLFRKGFSVTEDAQPLTTYLYQKARQFVAEGQWENAIRVFGLISDWNADDRAQIGYVVGELYIAQQRAMDALRTLSDTIKLPQAPAEAFLRLGSLLLEQEKAEDAMEVIRSGSRKYPDMASFPLALGGLYADDGLYEEALLAYEDAVRIAKQNQQNRINQGKNENKPNPLQQNMLLAMAAVQERLGRHADATDTLQQVLGEFPDNHLAMNFLAYMWAEQNIRIEEAYELSRKSLVLDPDNPAYLDTLGWIYFQQGDLDQALKYLLQAHAFLQGDYEINLHLGDAYAALGQPEKALHYWQESLRAKPAQDNRAWQQLLNVGIDPQAWLEQLPTAEEEAPVEGITE